MTVFDSQGNQHDINLFYVKTGDNTWDIWTQDSSVANSPLVKSAQMTFDKNGGLDNVKEYTEVAPVPPATEPTWTLGAANATPSFSITTGTVNGAVPATFTLSLQNSMQQNTGTNAVIATTQNGYKPGDLVSYQINDDGTVVGNYSNEQKQVLGQIVLANFANNEGLASQGDNVWAATQASGVELLGTAGTGNFGKLTNGALESSNVDLSKELVNMIVAQRNYQSNAQTIKTQDQILNTLVNLR